MEGIAVQGQRFGSPGQVGAGGRKQGNALVPKVMSEDRIALFDALVAKQDRMGRLAQLQAQDAARIVAENKNMLPPAEPVVKPQHQCA